MNIETLRKWAARTHPHSYFYQVFKIECQAYMEEDGDRDMCKATVTDLVHGHTSVGTAELDQAEYAISEACRNMYTLMKQLETVNKTFEDLQLFKERSPPTRSQHCTVAASNQDDGIGSAGSHIADCSPPSDSRALSASGIKSAESGASSRGISSSSSQNSPDDEAVESYVPDDELPTHISALNNYVQSNGQCPLDSWYTTKVTMVPGSQAHMPSFECIMTKTPKAKEGPQTVTAKGASKKIAKGRACYKLRMHLAPPAQDAGIPSVPRRSGVTTLSRLSSGWEDVF